MNSSCKFTAALLAAIFIVIFTQTGDARHVKKSSRKSKAKKDDIPVQLSIDGNKFTSVGCFRDAWNRVLPALEGEHQLLMEPNYKARKFALLKCARAARDKKLKVFGIENGGQCFGAQDEHSLNKYGNAVECRRDGKGGPWSLQAYKFTSFPTNGGFSPWSRWTTCSKTCDHGVRRRMRTCSNPPPSNGGKDCSGLGPSVEGEICKDKECPTVLIDEAETGNTAKPSRMSTTPTVAAVAPTYRPSISPSKDKEGSYPQSNQQETGHTENKNSSPIITLSIQSGSDKESSDSKSPQNSETSKISEHSNVMQTLGTGKPLDNTQHSQTSDTEKQSPKEDASKATSSEKPKEAAKESSADPSKPPGELIIKVSGDPMPVIKETGDKVEQAEKQKDTGTELKAEKDRDEAKSKPSNVFNDPLTSQQVTPVQESVSQIRPHSTSQSSEPFQFIDEPEDQRLHSIGNPYSMSSMHQSDDIKSHEQMNMPDSPQDIDPSVIEDTYNGGPVVPSSAVQLNTPLGPMVMGEVSPLNSNFNPNEQQNDQQTSSNEECFCPKKVCDAKADVAFLVDGSSDIPQVYFSHVLDFMKPLTRGFSSENMQVNIVAYGDDAASAFNTFTPVRNLHEIDDSIDSMSYMGGEPRTGNALIKVQNGLFKTFSRPDAKHAVVLLTSGSSSDDTLRAAEQLRDAGIKLTTIGLGKLANVKELIDISSEPKSKHVFTAFLDTLPDIMDEIVKDVCSDVDGKLYDKSEACVCGANKVKNSKDKATNSSLKPSKGTTNKGPSMAKLKQATSDKTTASKTKNETKLNAGKGHNVDHSGDTDNSEHINTSTHVSPHKTTDSVNQTQKSDSKNKDQNKENTVKGDNEKTSQEKLPSKNTQSQSQEVGSGEAIKENSKNETTKLKTDEKVDSPLPQVNKNEKAVPKKDEKEENTKATGVSPNSQNEHQGGIEIPLPLEERKRPQENSNQNEATRQTDSSTSESKNSQSNENKQNGLDIPKEKQKNSQENANSELYKQTDSSQITILDNGYSKLMKSESEKAHRAESSKPRPVGNDETAPDRSKERGPSAAESQRNNQGSPTSVDSSNKQESKTPEKIIEATESSSPPKNSPNNQQQSHETASKTKPIQELKDTSVSAQVNVPNPSSKTSNDSGEGKKKETQEEQKGHENVQKYQPRLDESNANTFLSSADNKKDADTKGKECSVNLGVVLDSKTTAYGEDDNAKKLLYFAKKLTHMFPVSPEGNRVGLMVYSGSPKLKVVHFDHTLDTNTMDKAIDSASYLNMEIKTGKVLNFAQEHLFSRIPSGKQNVLLLITDGVSYDDVTSPALELKRRGVEIFVVGVGEGVIGKELESIASEPTADHVIKTPYDIKESMLEYIKLKVCSSAQKKGKYCDACVKHSTIPLSTQHAELKKKSVMKPWNDAYLPRRRGHLYRVLTEIERRRK